MLSMETTTKLAPEKILVKLKAYFGEGGLGLELTRDTESCLTFEGGGGYVAATLCVEGERTRLSFETREWEIDVRRFSQEL